MGNVVRQPSRRQVAAARIVTAWYMRMYYRTEEDVGVAEMFCRQDRVGHFAVDRAALAAGAPEALFGMLVTMTMFQRRSDAQIMRVLRGIARDDAHEMIDADRLLALADSGCEHARTLDALLKRCDLGKCPVTKRGICGQHRMAACHLKRHTELLKRYGHFGKVPTSAALTLRAHGVENLAALREHVWETYSDPHERAVALEEALSRSWRISEKIAAMYLSAVTNRDLSGELAPWADGVDTDHFVVIDSNVDLFLRAIGYDDHTTYRARRAFLQALAGRVHLDELHPGVRRYNPRIVQQALYMFMSESNRRESARDCSHQAPASCRACPRGLASRCSLNARALATAAAGGTN
jgi:hypothetical protein